MTTFTPTIAWCTPCVERARRAHCFTLWWHRTPHWLKFWVYSQSPTVLLMALSLWLDLSLLPLFFLHVFLRLLPPQRVVLELDNPIVMASLRCSAVKSVGTFYASHSSWRGRSSSGNASTSRAPWKTFCQSRWTTDVPVTQRCVSVGVQQYRCGDSLGTWHQYWSRATRLIPELNQAGISLRWTFCPASDTFQSVHRTARWHCTCRRNEPDFVSNCDTFPRPLSAWWEIGKHGGAMLRPVDAMSPHRTQFSQVDWFFWTTLFPLSLLSCGQFRCGKPRYGTNGHGLALLNLETHDCRRKCDVVMWTKLSMCMSPQFGRVWCTWIQQFGRVWCIWTQHVKWPLLSVVVRNVASGSGETGSPHSKPLACLFRSDGDIGGGGIAPQALLLTLWACTSQCFIVPYLHRGTSWNWHIMLRQDRHAHQFIMTLVSNFRMCDFRARVVVVSTIGFSVDSERKEYHDMISFKSKQKARQFGPWRFNYSPFGLAVKTIESIVAACYHFENALSQFGTNYQQAGFPCQILSEGFWAATHLPLHCPSSLTLEQHWVTSTVVHMKCVLSWAIWTVTSTVRMTRCCWRQWTEVLRRNKVILQLHEFAVVTARNGQQIHFRFPAALPSTRKSSTTTTPQTS